MLKGLGCLIILLFIAIFIVLFVVASVFKTISSFLGLGRFTDFTGKTSKQKYDRSRQTENPYGKTTSEGSKSRSGRNQTGGKVISDDEGEYIDFEEVK